MNKKHNRMSENRNWISGKHDWISEKRNGGYALGNRRRKRGRKAEIFSAIGVGIILFVFVLLLRTVVFVSRQAFVPPVERPAVDVESIAEHMSQALRIPTVSRGDGQPVDEAAFTAFHAFLEQTWPEAHKAMSREIVNQYSLLYTWPGSDPSLKPILLLAHMDVVPADNAEAWQQPPFAGTIVDGEIWGRGALDDKVGCVSLMEGIENLVKQGFVPKRTVMFAMGHDEEIMGPEGATQVAALLRERGIAFEAILEEGGILSEDMLPAIDAPVALIGIAEKGYLSLMLTASGITGHSSLPPKHTAIGILADAVSRIEDARMPARIDGAVAEMFAYSGPEMSFPMKLVFANRWLFDGVIKGIMGSSASDNAMIRSTTAVTMVQGGVKDNVLPSEASAVVNCRILPGESISAVQERLVKAVDDDRVTFSVVGEVREPSAISSPDTRVYRGMERVIHQVFPEAIVAPFLIAGGTDSAHYADLADATYRFRPVLMTPERMHLAHAANERISVENLAECVMYEMQLIEMLCGVE